MQSTPKRVLFLCPYVVHVGFPYMELRVRDNRFVANKSGCTPRCGIDRLKHLVDVAKQVKVM